MTFARVDSSWSVVPVVGAELPTRTFRTRERSVRGQWKSFAPGHRRRVRMHSERAVEADNSVLFVVVVDKMGSCVELEFVRGKSCSCVN